MEDRHPQPLDARLVALPETSAAVLYGVHEVFRSVGTTWDGLTGQQTAARRIRPRIVAAGRAMFRSTLGVPIAADATFGEAGTADVVVVPDIDIGDGRLPRFAPEVLEWLRAQHEGGATVCSVCSGSLMLAAAGLLDGLEATTHWGAAALFAEHFGAVRLHAERILLPSGTGHRIVTSGGSAAWAELVLYLVARFCGRSEALRIAKLFLFGDRSDGQLPFAMLARPKQHDDSVIADAQAWIGSNYEKPNPVGALIARSGLAPRTFARRFRQATGYTPIEYVQTLRIEEAKQLLESTADAVDDIARAVGYDDSGSFRRLFKRLTGISARHYRQRFRLPALAASAG